MHVQFGQNGVIMGLALEHVASARKPVNELVRMVSSVKRDAMSGRQLMRQHAIQTLAHYGLIGPSGLSVLLLVLRSKVNNFPYSVVKEVVFLVKSVKLAVRVNRKKYVSVTLIYVHTGQTGKLPCSAPQPVVEESN